MGFLGVYRALYDYIPHEDAELAIKQGDLVYVLEKNDDDGWWKAKKKAGTDDEDEPIGLIPNNYVEKVYLSSPRLPPSPRLPAPSRPSTSACPSAGQAALYIFTDLRLHTGMRMLS